MDIELELSHSEQEKILIDGAINRNCRANFQFAEDHFHSLPLRREEYAFQEVLRASELFSWHEELRERETAARKLQTEQWTHLLGVAEDAFIETAILGRMQEGQQVEEERPALEQPGSQDPQPEDIRQSNSEISRQGVRENLRVAKEACRKAREEFEGPRILSEEEIEQLPQPVTEDMLGVARVMKLERLTHALNSAEEAYRDARKKAREAGITRPHEQTADFSDRSDDGYAESVLQKAVTQGRERVARVQGWTGLHLEQEAAGLPNAQAFLPLTFQRLRPVRLGEDSFDISEASGRTRGQIDAMRVNTKRLRDSGLPRADKDPLLIARD